ncbi:MAG: hypothetical protein OXE41_06055 [Gammaproteobacteria bacterium]|nr:hypothetical protein [Gammaproteobacteria bacterium]MCY4274942.1 hypothetical protein [Gammaproteobacteria bacterium]
MFFGFAFRTSLVMVPILVIGITITSVLSLHKFSQTFSNLINSRFEFVTGEIRNGIQTQLDLGLFLENLEITQILEEYQISDDQILSIEVFDNRGVVLHSSDSSSVSDLVPEEWINRWRLNSTSSSWTLQERNAGVVGVSIRNNLGQDIGSVVLRYSRNLLDQNVKNEAQNLIAFNAIATLITILVAFFSAMFILSRLCNEFRSMGKVMDIVRTNKKMDNEDNQQNTDIRTSVFHEFISKTLSTNKEMDLTIMQARSLDEGKEN